MNTPENSRLQMNDDLNLSHAAFGFDSGIFLSDIFF